MTYEDASIAVIRARDHHFRMFLLGDTKRIEGALNLLKLATRRRLLAK
jgi:hypothetical protein